MAKHWNPFTWLVVIVAAIGLLLTLVVGVLPAYMKYTATPLHPQPQNAPSITSSEPAKPWTDAVEQGRQIMRAGLSEQNLPGLSVAVGVGGDIVWAEGFGWADIEKRAPVTPDTRFRIGTASHMLTSAAIGVLQEKDRLQLDAEMQKYVPQFPKKQWPVTLRQVMGHVSGVSSDGGDEGQLFSQKCERPVEGLQAFAYRPLRFEPGTQHRYSNYGGILLSAAVEAASQEPFLTFMRKQIFEPARMNRTLAESSTLDIPDRATLYFPRFGSDPKYGLHLMRDLELSCYAGAMAFLSTPSDMVRFGLAMNSGKLLRPATIRLFQTSQRLTSGEETGYGLGWDLETVTLRGVQTTAVGHDGKSLGGRVVSFMTFPDRGIVVAVMSNISYADTSALALRVAEAFAEPQNSPARK